MAKLRNLQSQLGSLRSTIASTPNDEPSRHRRRDATQPWRAWYKTARWQKLRAFILKRDLYTCQRTGVLIIGKHPAPNSPVANHKIPHRGDPELFWDPDNIEAVSKAYHDSQIQKEEQSVIKGVWY